MNFIRKHIFTTLLFCFFISTVHQTALANSTLKRVKYPYLLHVPEDYAKYPDRKWPVIFYLHGRHASGKNLKSVQRYGLPYYLLKGKKLDFIVVSPQCPWGKNWASENWFDPVYDEVALRLRVDENRIYLTGMSMGGFGTWELANRMPDRFAAISPMCGGGKSEWADHLSKIPAWVFHGTADRQIPIGRSEAMVKALEVRHANVKFSRLVNQGHDISKEFDNDELYRWLGQFSLAKKPFWEESMPFMKSIAVRKIEVNLPLRSSSNLVSIR